MKTRLTHWNVALVSMTASGSVYAHPGHEGKHMVELLHPLMGEPWQYGIGFALSILVLLLGRYLHK